MLTKIIFGVIGLILLGIGAPMAEDGGNNRYKTILGVLVAFAGIIILAGVLVTLI